MMNGCCCLIEGLNRAVNCEIFCGGWTDRYAAVCNPFLCCLNPELSPLVVVSSHLHLNRIPNKRAACR